MSSASKGKVILLGAGPGDPELLTLKGMRVLGLADVVIYDYLASKDLLNLAPAGAERIYVGKRAGRHTLVQEEINRLLVTKAGEANLVVRLKGGDPFVFGRGGEEAVALEEAGIPFEIVPGVTSGIAAPAYAGIPVTHRESASSLAFVTGHEDPNKPESAIQWAHLPKGVDTLVFYMGVKQLPHIVAKLRENGRPSHTPVALIEHGTKPRQRTVQGTLDTIVQIASEEKIMAPAITVVGEVVRLRERLAWFDRLPLSGKRIINTRSRSQSSDLTHRLKDLGADVPELPTIEVVSADESSELAGILREKRAYDWVVFTSPNGVRSLFDLLLHIHGDVRSLGPCRIASIGPGTTVAIQDYRLQVDVTAKRSVAEGLVEALSKAGIGPGCKVLVPQAEKARDVVPRALREWGADVDAVKAYRTRPSPTADPDLVRDLCKGDYDLVTFSSSSTFEFLVEMAGHERGEELIKNLKAASIGPVTSSAIRSRGVEPKLEASPHTIPGLVKGIVRFFDNRIGENEST